MVISNGETSDLIFKTKMRSNQLVLVVLLSASVMLGGSSAKLLSSKASPKGLMPHVVRQLMLVYIYMLCRRTTVVCKRQRVDGVAVVSLTAHVDVYLIVFSR